MNNGPSFPAVLFIKSILIILFVCVAISRSYALRFLPERFLMNTWEFIATHTHIRILKHKIRV